MRLLPYYNHPAPGEIAHVDPGRELRLDASVGREPPGPAVCKDCIGRACPALCGRMIACLRRCPTADRHCLPVETTGLSDAKSGAGCKISLSRDPRQAIGCRDAMGRL